MTLVGTGAYALNFQVWTTLIALLPDMETMVRLIFSMPMATYIARKIETATTAESPMNAIASFP